MNERLEMNRNASLIRGALALAAAGILVTGVAACGGSSDSAASTAAGTAATATTAAQTATTVAVTMGSPKEFSMVPAAASAPAGKVTFDVKNAGSMVHEFVVIKTPNDAGKLPVKNGEASEAGAVGEIADMKAGTQKSVTLDLKPGHYAFICNLPGHYLGGMYANFEVK